ncbi:hypothetical protein C4D60_Mb11t19600 [Musa balbisiana]|uniref:Histone deacetylase complex subunit SAP30 Sin3 binding domain-containing protein n=1 Tax=Musa balbisiana TaxID=52838 RepID=A0A4S8J5A8_MUSBA|nr:hypothetical protein C4D60_Mb11t19600 [Musa balbisiana]
MRIMEAELCSARTLSPSREESGDEELSVLPRHTKVIVTGNNRTKSVLVGLQGVVKKAVGLGGWHWLVLKNGVEVKLQRNALSVLEAPTGNEDEDDEIDCDNSFCSSSDVGDKDIDYSCLEFHKPTKPRVRHTRPWTCSAKSNGRSSNYRDTTHSNGHKSQTNLCVHQIFGLLPAQLSNIEFPTAKQVGINTKPTKEQLLHVLVPLIILPPCMHEETKTPVIHSLLPKKKKQVDEMQVIVGFIHAAKRLKTRHRKKKEQQGGGLRQD